MKLINIALLLGPAVCFAEPYEIPENGGMLYVAGTVGYEISCDEDRVLTSYPNHNIQIYLTDKTATKIVFSEGILEISEIDYPSVSAYQFGEEFWENNPGCGFAVAVYPDEISMTNDSLKIMNVNAGSIVNIEQVYVWSK